MKNPLLLFLIWIFVFFIEVGAQMKVGGFTLKIYGSYFVLSYVLLVLPLASSFLFFSLVGMILCSFSQFGYEPLLPLFVVLLFSLGERVRIRSDSFVFRALRVAFFLTLAFTVVEALRGYSLMGSIPAIRFIVGGSASFFGGAVIYYLLEVPGAMLEQKIFPFALQQGQLNLFRAKGQTQLGLGRAGHRKRKRRRYGLKEGW